MLSLTDRLRERIRREGAITFYDWMNAALYDSAQGYYCTPARLKWGRAGDYRTSPERSVLFAATFARYFAKLYQELGSPASWTLIEVGAGNGQFAAGMLDTLRLRSPRTYAATTYVIDDISTDARSRAETLLAEFGERVQFSRLCQLTTLRQGVIFSNELLDAFPVHRVMMQAGELREYFVGVDADGKFEWTLAPPSQTLSEYLTQVGVRLAEGQVAEINPGIEDWLKSVSSKLNEGYVVTVDYGDEAQELYNPSVHPEGTLRAFRQHQFVDDVLARPGEQDITSSVDWTLVQQAGARLGLEAVEFARQDRFLLDAGLLDELEIKASEAADEAEELRLRTSAREMILPNGMAGSFQVLVQEKL